MEKCLDCHKNLTGRVDKRFCDSYCRSHYHNSLNIQRNESFRKVNHILRRNATILQKLSRQDVHVFSKHTLSAAGFNFSFFTHVLTVNKDELYHCCYHYGYRYINQSELVLGEFPFTDATAP